MSILDFAIGNARLQFEPGHKALTITRLEPMPVKAQLDASLSTEVIVLALCIARAELAGDDRYRLGAACLKEWTQAATSFLEDCPEADRLAMRAAVRAFVQEQIL